MLGALQRAALLGNHAGTHAKLLREVESEHAACTARGTDSSGMQSERGQDGEVVTVAQQHDMIPTYSVRRKSSSPAP